MASGEHLAPNTDVTTDTTREFLRSFSVVDTVESDESDFDELTPIPETSGDNLDETDIEAEGKRVVKFIPYKSVFASAVPFSSQRDNCWIPGQPIIVNIVHYDRQPALKMLNPNLYTIEVTHGEYHWTLYRRYKHFRQLHDSLALFRAKYSLPLPSRDYHQRRATIKKDIEGMKQRQTKAVRLPLRPEPLVSEEKIPQRMQQLQDYLQNLVTCKSYRNHPETLKFFEVSHLSFMSKTGIKSKEGLVKKCSGGRRINIQCCGCLQNLILAGTWNTRWLVVKDSFILYIRPEDGQISDVLLMDSAFSVTSGLSKTGAKHGCLIENLSRKLLLKCWTSRKAREWAEQITSVAKTLSTDYTHKNRFGSFAPERDDSFARWFVDGKTYFEAVADALEKAKEEIYITDWWLSPEIYMKRPMVDGDHWRLDLILKRKAEQGIKIFILLYKEIKVALNIQSDYSKQRLMTHSPENIKVLRHPDHIPGKGVLMWAHHEKLVIIDQQIAFAGGIDLCYGRWDDQYHKMTDLGSVSLKPKSPLGTSDVNLQHFPSQTEVSVMTEDNVSEPDADQFVSVPPAHPENRGNTGGQVGDTSPKPDYQISSNGKSLTDSKVDPKTNQQTAGCDTASELPDQRFHSDSILSTSSKDSSNSTSVLLENSQNQRKEPDLKLNQSSHPVEANVLVTITNPSMEEDTWNQTPEEDSYHHRRAKTVNDAVPTSKKTHFLARGTVAASSLNDDGKLASRQLKKQASSIIDTEGFSDSVLGEINQSMTPFKDIHNDSFFNVPHEKINLDDVSFEHLNSGFSETLDTEIITSLHAENASKGSKAGSPSQSPSSSRKEPHSERKISHLWSRRRSKKESLELIIPSKTGKQKKSIEPSTTEAKNQGDTNDQTTSGSKKMRRQLAVLKREDDQTDTSDDGSIASNPTRSVRASAPNILTSGASSLGTPAAPEAVEGKDSLSAAKPTNRQFSFSGAASAMNALRKMMHRKEENNNDSGNASPTSRDEPANAARRRWKMILNVSKFEDESRTPQGSEMMDESLFYSKNIPHPKTRHRLMKTFREGVDKLARHGGHRGSMELDLSADRKQLPLPAGMYHTKSEENILERGLLGSTKLWIGKDYVNFIHKDFVSLDLPFEDFIDRSKCPRMPWHDIGCVLYGKSARDLARHFIGRWNFTKLKKCKTNPNFPLLIPKTLTNCTISHAIQDINFPVKAQVLRSCGGWSTGIGTVEYSIHEAYEHCIENARNYIYIENQFFITQVGNNSTVKNGIGKALFKRIMRAHRSNSNFKVYVVMPLLPAFEGEFGTNTGAALQAVTHWNYSSICRGGFSLMEKLAQEVPDPNKYIVFCGLRSWDRLNGHLFSELIYVHSKLMIVDDDTVIIGSANINDRSLLGSRDSEIAVLFEDVDKVNVTVNGKQYQAGKFASSLRWTIFREHLGIQDDPDFVDLTDITSDSFYKEVWIKRAAINTTCFDKVFKCLPTDNVQNYAQLREYQSSPPLARTNEEEALNWLKKVKGYLVLIPLQFLKEEKLTPRVGQKEAMVPTQLWT